MGTFTSFKSRRRQSLHLSTDFWRFLNLILVHPVCSTIALKKLADDQMTGGKNGKKSARRGKDGKRSVTQLLSEMMHPDAKGIPDSIQGLVYQSVALVDMLSEEGVAGVTEGVDKSSIIQNLFQNRLARTMYDGVAMPYAKQYIKMQKTRT
jgi:hypothetical protein